jgi:hypothetical protein
MKKKRFFGSNKKKNTVVFRIEKGTAVPQKCFDMIYKIQDPFQAH